MNAPLMMKNALAMAGVGMVYVVMRRIPGKTLEPAVAKHAYMVDTFPALSEVLSEMSHISCGGFEFEDFVARVAEVCALDEHPSAVTPWQISKGIADAQRMAESVCSSSVKGSLWANAERVQCRVELLERLGLQLDNLLHNHLLMAHTN